MIFKKKLERIIDKNNSLLCVGLDPEMEKIPQHLKKLKYPFFEFNKEIVDATYDLVCAYKPNIAFYESLGLKGLEQLKMTAHYLRKKYPEIPIVVDAKRGDIGNTMNHYAKSIFEYWKFDAVTVHPFLGLDSLKPFFQYKDKLIIILVKFSNPDSKMFMDLKTGKDKFYLNVAKTIAKWPYDNIGIMAGATYPQELQQLRNIFPDNIFLSPGLGAQGGDVNQAVGAGVDSRGKGIMFNASRAVIYASKGKDFNKIARDEAIKLKNEINKYRIL